MTPEQIAFEQGKDMMRAAVAEVLGLDGEHDAIDNLEGALIDLRRTGANKICIDTVERVQAQLATIMKMVKI